MMHRFIELSFIQAAKEIGIDIPNINFERPKIADHGHLSTNIAMTLAKLLKRKPQDIAQDIIAHLKVDSTIIDNVEIAGAGFINIYLNPHAFHLAMMQMITIGSHYGRSNIGSGKTANVEYVSANPTGKLHLGHGRNAAIGDTVSNLLEWTGYTVTREYYFNNAGNQMNMLATSIFAR